MRKPTFAVFAALAAILATPATAEVVSFQVKIPYGDLNLTEKADVAQLRARIRTAVREACTNTDTTSDANVDQACLVRTMQAANAKLEQRRSHQLAMLAR